MQWHSATEFFAMGGYALYVWGSFGLCAVAMIIEPLLLRRRRLQVERSLRRRRAAEGTPAAASWSASRLEGTR
jgi:heme exporter protein D